MFRLFCFEDGDSSCLQNTGVNLPNYTAYNAEDRNLHLLNIFNFLLYNVSNVACESSAVKYDIVNALGLGGQPALAFVAIYV
jgi:hypothetical protein